MKIIESRGKTLEEAIESGLNQLSLTREDVDITILDEASKGFLGFGAKPARVLMTEKLRRVNRAEDEERQAREKQLRDEENRRLNEERLRQQQEQREKEKREKAEQAALAEKAREQEKAERALKIEKARQVAAQNAQSNQRRAPRPEASAPAPAKTERAERPERSERAERSEKVEETRPARRPQQQRSPEQRAEPRNQRQASAGRVNREPMELREAKEKADVPGIETEMSREAKEYLSQLLSLMGVDVELTSVEKPGGLYMNASGPDAGTLIGYRGETLDALQYLVSLKINKSEDDYHRVSLDAEDYRAKREEILVKLAHRLASKAVKTGRKVSLEPMNPYERRILHSALQGHANVRTHSEGSDPYRRVVITPKSLPRRQGPAQPANGRRGAANTANAANAANPAPAVAVEETTAE